MAGVQKVKRLGDRRTGRSLINGPIKILNGKVSRLMSENADLNMGTWSIAKASQPGSGIPIGEGSHLRDVTITSHANANYLSTTSMAGLNTIGATDGRITKATTASSREHNELNLNLSDGKDLTPETSSADEAFEASTESITAGGNSFVLGHRLQTKRADVNEETDAREDNVRKMGDLLELQGAFNLFVSNK
ncbi:Ff.00g065130.m01.CDS01 [Fusarium sp. VM40]|nr:Ff.00g065130.m01.CDS01 [Fusarium sp. VM40]